MKMNYYNHMILNAKQVTFQLDSLNNWPKLQLLSLFLSGLITSFSSSK